MSNSQNIEDHSKSLCRTYGSVHLQAPLSPVLSESVPLALARQTIIDFGDVEHGPEERENDANSSPKKRMLM
jgi:hypothetical protein